MKRLIYRSIASPELSAQDVFGIIQGSSERNGTKQLNGFLVFQRQRFLQLLEGSEGEIDDLFAKVRVDPRHSDVEILSDQLVGTPCFSRWRMRRLTADDPVAALAMLQEQQTRSLPVRELSVVKSFLNELSAPTPGALA